MPYRFKRRWVVAGSIAAFAACILFWARSRRSKVEPLNALPLPLTPIGIRQLADGVRQAVRLDWRKNAQKLIARGLTADLVNDLSKISGLRVVSGTEAGPAKQPGEISGSGRPRVVIC